MELFQLVYASTLANHLNFSVAAEKLFITQPALSQQIQKLERELGFSIFFRNKKVVLLTYEGEQFIKGANKVILDAEMLKKNAEKLIISPEQSITFGVSAMSSTLVTGSINRFLKAFQKVNLKLIEASDPDLITMVQNRELDFAFVLIPHSFLCQETIAVTRIQSEYICAVLAKDHKLAKNPYISVSDLIDEKLVFSSSKSFLRSLLFSAMSEYGYSPEEMITLTNIEARISLIMDGAISFALSKQPAWNNSPDIVLIPIKPHIMTLLVLISPIEKELSVAEKSFVDIICKDVKEILNPKQQ